jgi:hypothetical protein
MSISTKDPTSDLDLAKARALNIKTLVARGHKIASKRSRKQRLRQMIGSYFPVFQEEPLETVSLSSPICKAMLPLRTEARWHLPHACRRHHNGPNRVFSGEAGCGGVT